MCKRENKKSYTENKVQERKIFSIYSIMIIEYPSIAVRCKGYGINKVAYNGMMNLYQNHMHISPWGTIEPKGVYWGKIAIGVALTLCVMVSGTQGACIEHKREEEPLLPPVTPRTGEHDSAHVHFELSIDSVVINLSRPTALYHTEPAARSEVKIGHNRGGSDLRQLSGVVPNFYMMEGGSRISCPIYVRGVGSTMGFPPVGLYVDGVPHFERDAFLLHLAGVERVEILRGPKTTLYGRNSAVGQMNVHTLPPQGQYAFLVRAEYGAFHDRNLLASGNVPMGKVWLRGTFFHRSTQGYLHNLGEGNRPHGNAHIDMGRLRTQIALPHRGRLFVGMDCSQSYDGGYGYHALDSLRVNPFRTYYDAPSGIERKRLHAALRWVQPLPLDITFTALLAYALHRDKQVMDNDFTHFDILTNARNVRKHQGTLELQAHGKIGEQLTWTTGFFSFYSGNKTLVQANFGEDAAMLIKTGAYFVKIMDYFHHNHTWGSALYGRVHWHEPYTELQFTLGLRGEWERCHTDYRQTLTMPSGMQLPWQLPLLDTVQSMKLLPHLMVLRQWGNRKQWSTYLSVARGYKPGGFNVLNNELMGGDSVHIAYQAERLWSYEAGVKYLHEERKVQMGMALFFTQWFDQQIFIIEKMGPAIRNAGNVHAMGVECELLYAPWTWLYGTLTGGYSHTRYVKHMRQEVVGKRSVVAPLFTLTGSLNGRWVLSAENKVVLHMQVRYTGLGDQYFDELNTLHQPYHGQLSGKIGVNIGGFSINGWVNNALDRRYFVYMFNNPLGKALPSYANSGQTGAPRSWGISLGWEL